MVSYYALIVLVNLILGTLLYYFSDKIGIQRKSALIITSCSLAISFLFPFLLSIMKLYYVLLVIFFILVLVAAYIQRNDEKVEVALTEQEVLELKTADDYLSSLKAEFAVAIDNTTLTDEKDELIYVEDINIFSMPKPDELSLLEKIDNVVETNESDALKRVEVEDTEANEEELVVIEEVEDTEADEEELVVIEEVEDTEADEEELVVIEEVEDTEADEEELVVIEEVEDTEADEEELVVIEEVEDTEADEEELVVIEEVEDTEADEEELVVIEEVEDTEADEEELVVIEEVEDTEADEEELVVIEEVEDIKEEKYDDTDSIQYINEAFVFRAKGNFDEAVKLLGNGLALTFDDKLRLMLTLEISSIYKEKGQYELASGIISAYLTQYVETINQDTQLELLLNIRHLDIVKELLVINNMPEIPYKAIPTPIILQAEARLEEWKWKLLT